MEFFVTILNVNPFTRTLSRRSFLVWEVLLTLLWYLSVSWSMQRDSVTGIQNQIYLFIIGVVVVLSLVVVIRRAQNAGIPILIIPVFIIFAPLVLILFFIPTSKNNKPVR